jgi:hypothetical protein
MKHEIVKMSTGQEATLGNYRKMCALIFGPDSKSVKYLDKRIAEEGEDEEVIVDESQMVYILTQIHLGNAV